MTTTEGHKMVAQRRWSGPSTSNLDAEIKQGLRELEILACIYQQRGNQKQADEIRLAIKQIEEQIAARGARLNCRAG
ncbi:MAG TPA: hypothetical protein V6D22_19930 [Candidatus Obscuribacterales bacterium]